MRYLAITVSLCLVSPTRADYENSEPARGAPAKFDATATPVKKIKAPKGFEVELIYSVPKQSQGSWVNMCVDPRGRLIVSDQFGELYRVTVPAKGKPGKPVVERVPIKLGQAQGLLWAFDSLYVVVNSDDDEPQTNGLYRARDTDGNDQLDSVVLLRKLDGRGEHGPHAVLAAPDGESLYIVCGDATRMTRVIRSRVPQIWDDDQLLPRISGVGGDFPAPLPAGCVYQVDPDGHQWELVSSGLRNAFDAAVSEDGELFTFDADAEQDLGTPWYRPTRVCHVVSGADWGWRRDSGKWPVAYPDTLPSVIDVGLGSPTGVTFGYGAKFPARYQRALYLCDWTYGRMYATLLEPQGASYVGTLEEFISGSPLPLTDVVVNPHDGAMYFIIGGRGIQSGLYRVTYVGNESMSPAELTQSNSEERKLRQRLEALHQPDQADAVERAWPHLHHPDRFIRYSARTAMEHRPLETWQDRALSETDPQSSLAALLALVRLVPRPRHPSGSDLDLPPIYPAKEAARQPLQSRVLAALDRLDWTALSNEQKLELLRVYSLTFYRLGPPDETTRKRLIECFDTIYPAAERETNAMLTGLMCYLQAPTVAEKGVKLLTAAPTQEEQLDIARSLRCLDVGWTRGLRREFFQWIGRAQSYKGGAAYSSFAREVKRDALARVPESERADLDELSRAARDQSKPAIAAARPFVKEWSMEELVPLIDGKLQQRDFEHGRQMFAAAQCFNCHRFAGEGGAIGPDLTSLAGRFSPRDILESVMAPDKVISDQYASVVVQTTSGQVITGRIVNYTGDEIFVNTDMLDPNIEASVRIRRDEIEEIAPSTVSMMPSGLLNTLHEDEILDLMAFLLSRGDRNDARFAK